MNDEDIKLIKRFNELAGRSYNNNVFTFTGFLSLPEQETFYSVTGEVKHAGYRLFGGASECERKMLRFGNPESFGYEEDFPISIVIIKPLMAKFSDELTHRDFLGALMNLGIERSTLGDILVSQNEAAVFCQTGIADFINTELTRVKHTSVKTTVISCEEYEEIRPEQQYKDINETVSSKRADLIIAKLCKLSRSAVLELFRTGLVAVNGRLLENNSAQLSCGDIISIRGYGKFLYEKDEYVNKKGKINIRIKKYI